MERSWQSSAGLGIESKHWPAVRYADGVRRLGIHDSGYRFERPTGLRSILNLRHPADTPVPDEISAGGSGRSSVFRPILGHWRRPALYVLNNILVAPWADIQFERLAERDAHPDREYSLNRSSSGPRWADHFDNPSLADHDPPCIGHDILTRTQHCSGRYHLHRPARLQLGSRRDALNQHVL